jgi:serine/threonine-protein kinase RsbW
MNDFIKLTIPCKPEYVSTVRLTLSSVASKADFDIDAIDDIKIAVSEACTNIINHSSLNPEDFYNVICAHSEGKIEITVEDDGRGFDVAQYSAPDEDEISESGLGLYIIRALMDEVNVESEVGKGTRYRMIKYKASGDAA